MTEDKKSNEELYREEKVSELEILRQSLSEHKKQAEIYYEQILRIKADFENYRKRSEKEKKEFFEDGKNSTIMELLDIFETVKLAKTMIEKVNSSESIQEGLQHIEKKLSEILKKHNVVQIATIGEKYDPMLHDIIGVLEQENVEDGIIIEEVKSGYKIGDRVLKPAIVKTAKKIESKETELKKED
ncbi:MAG: nucleotide exchange factor GrpE [Elusimicrobia bacterium]|nr:nucleotide exchange factor GrpE [Elusimicrobiota bacterium]